MAYLTKDKNGLIQLWNNKPKYNKIVDCYYAWIDRKNNRNEIAIEVNNNDYIRSLFNNQNIPCCLEIEIIFNVL